MGPSHAQPASKYNHKALTSKSSWCCTNRARHIALFVLRHSPCVLLHMPDTNRVHLPASPQQMEKNTLCGIGRIDSLDWIELEKSSWFDTFHIAKHIHFWYLHSLPQTQSIYGITLLWVRNSGVGEQFNMKCVQDDELV